MPYHCSKCGREWDDPGAEENAYTCTRACGGRLVSAGGEESPELTGLAERPLKIFLSYGHEPPEHVDVALRLKADLEARGHDVWFDLDKLKARSRWETEIERAIVTSDRVVVLMTPYSVRRADPTADAESPAARDGYCLNEVAKAYERNKNIVPIMLAWVDQGPPTSICSIQWLDMMDCVPIADRLAVYEQTRFPRLVEALEHGKLESEGGWAKIRRHLDPLDFHREMEKHIADFSGREWLLGRDGAMNRRFADEPDSRVFWILGDPGVGKSAIATQLAHRRGDVGAVHFCVHNNTDFIDSRAAVLSIAYQLATCLPAYQERLESLDLAAEAVKDTYTLFHNVIVLPLAALEKEAGFTPRRLLVVIDALDEATRDGRNEMAEFIAAHWDETPQWLRLVITSRKEVAVVSCLSAYRPFILDKDSDDNQKDVREYLVEMLTRVSGAQPSPIAVDAILAKSEGLFLYVKVVVDEIGQGRLSLDNVEAFPDGLGEFYRRFFSRQFPPGEIDRYKELIRPILNVIASRLEPLPMGLLCKATGLDDFKIRQDRLPQLGSLFPVRHSGGDPAADTITPFHKSVTDWLTERNKYTGAFRAGDYAVDQRAGEKALAEAGWKEYRADVSTMDAYFLRHLSTHLAGQKDWIRFEDFVANTSVIEARCDRQMVSEIVGDLFRLDLHEQPVERFTVSLLDVFREKLFERLRQQLRSSLKETFGSYVQWPAPLRTGLEQSTDLKLMLFLGDTHDMEERFDQAESVFRRLLASTAPRQHVSYATACARLASVLEHQNRPKEALDITELFNAQPEMETQCPSTYYWWVQYQRVINLRRLHRYEEAITLAKRICASSVQQDQAISALHQLGTIDLELGRFAEAEAAYLECLKERGDNEWNHRRAFEHRRLGQLHALMGQPTAARTAFDKALEIAERCGNARFARNARQDTVAFVDIPAFLRKERPEKVCLSTLAGQFDPKPSQLQPAFRVLWQEHQGYLPLLDPKTGETTDEVVRWDVAHSQGFWHPVVMVLMHDGEGNIALQERGERDSMGRLDTTVAGHQEVGETDVVCAIRETVEETGLLMSPSRLCRVDKPYNLVKRGSPDVDNDGHESGLCYRYHTNKINQERASLFVARVAEGEELQPMDVGTGRTHFEWVPLLDAVHRVEQDPDRFASSFKHLLSDEILTLLQESMM